MYEFCNLFTLLEISVLARTREDAAVDGNGAWDEEAEAARTCFAFVASAQARCVV